MAQALVITDDLVAAWDACATISKRPGTGPASSHVLLKATAGTGKTTALSWLNQKLQERGIETQPLAFSKRGVERFQSLLYPKGNCVSLDALAFNVLRQNSVRKRWEQTNINAVMGERAQLSTHEIMRQVIEDLNTGRELAGEELLDSSNDALVEYAQLVNTLKASMVFKRAPFSYLEEYGELDEYQEEDVQIALANLGLERWIFSLFTKFENRRDSANILNFADASYDLCSEPEALERYCKNRGLRVVLLDEFHDTRPAHYQLLRIMARCGVSVIAAGDPAQDIFEWRGIRPFDAVGRMLQDFNHTTICPLRQTYRFGVPLASKVESYLGAMQMPAEILPARHGTRVQKLERESTDAEMAQYICGLVQSNAAENAVIIVPSAQHGYPLLAELNALDIRVGTPHIAQYHASAEALLVRALCRLVYPPKQLGEMDVSDAMAFEVLLKLPALPISPEQREQLRSMLVLERVGGERRKTYLTDQIDTVLSLLQQGMKDWVVEASADSRVLRLVDQLQIKKWLASKVATAAALRCIQRSFNRFFTMMVRGPDEFVRHLDLARQIAQKTGRPHIEMTSVIHSKGLEWDVVVLPPNTWEAPQDDRMHRREFYVAMSRAKHAIHY